MTRKFIHATEWHFLKNRASCAAMLLIACAQLLSAAVPGPGGVITEGIPGIQVVDVLPAGPGPLYEHVFLKNRLVSKWVLTNFTGQLLTFDTGTVFYLDEQGNLMGTSPLSQQEFGRRVSTSRSFSFNDGGEIYTVVKDRNAPLAAMAPGQAKASFFAGGTVTLDDGPHLYLLNVLTNGALKNDFGSDGVVIGPLGKLQAIAHRPILNLYVVGEANTGGRFLVAAYKLNGDPDNTFNDETNVVVGRFEPGRSSIAEAAFVDPGGAVVVAGRSFDDTGSRLGLARFVPNGPVDNSFGLLGAIGFETPGGDVDRVAGIQVDMQGRLIVGATLSTPVGREFLFARFTTNGLLDPSFGDLGWKRVVGPNGAQLSMSSLRLDAAGRIVAAGAVDVQPGDGLKVQFALARLSPDGVPDDLFGDQGVVVADFVSRESELIRGFDFDAGGRIVVAGRASDDENYAFALARYTPDGQLATTFDSDGKVLTSGFDFAESMEARAVHVLADGSVLAGGTALVGGESKPIFIRYRPDGDLFEGIPDRSAFTLNLTDLPFFTDLHEQGFDGFLHKRTPPSINLHLKFHQFAEPFRATGLAPVARQPRNSYRWPLGPLGSGLTWIVGNGHESGVGHAGVMNQTFAHDISAHYADDDASSTRTNITPELIATWTALWSGHPNFDPEKEYEASDFNESRLAYRQRIYAAAAGRVVSALNNVIENFPTGEKLSAITTNVPSGGNGVVIEHSGGEFSFYGHMRTGSLVVTNGQWVEAGDLLGELGNSGNSTGPHLHFHVVDAFTPSASGGGTHGDGLPVYFNNVRLNAGDGRGFIRHLRSGISTSSRVLVDMSPMPPAPIGEIHGPGTVKELEFHYDFTFAQRVALPVVVNGMVSPDDVAMAADAGDGLEDIYRFTLNKPGILTARLVTSAATDLDLLVYDRHLMAIDPFKGKTAVAEEFWQGAVDAGTHFVAVSQFDGVAQPIVADYELQLAFAPRLPIKILVSRNAAGGREVELRWAADADSEGFRLEESELLATGARWRAVDAGRQQIGSEFIVRLPIAEASRFYRLARHVE